MARTLVALVTAALMQTASMAHAADTLGPQQFRIVSPDWVARHAADPNVRVLDVRTSIAAYQTSHIPQAVFLANDALRAPQRGIPVQFLDPEEMASLFRRSGIDPEHTVVVYGEDGEVLGATMTAYALHRIGHRNVAIVDGGIEAYRERHTLTQEYPEYGEGTLRPRFDGTIVATFDDVKSAMKDPDVLIIDARPLNEYLGETNRWIRNGHIPGSVSLHWRHLMRSHSAHAFKSLEEMRELIEATGARIDRDIIVYCGTGREATLLYNVMRHTLGYPKVRLYEGSWTEYAAKQDMPVQREPGRVVAPTAQAKPPGAPASRSEGSREDLPRAMTITPFNCGTIARLHTVDGVFMGSQPTREDYAVAASLGIRSVFNQRNDHEVGEFNARAVVESLGMRYAQVAWNGPEQLTDKVLDDSRSVLREIERPVLFHCATANRTGAIWLAYSVLDRGLDWEDALAEAKTVGLTSPAYTRIVGAYVERRRVER